MKLRLAAQTHPCPGCNEWCLPRVPALSNSPAHPPIYSLSAPKPRHLATTQPPTISTAPINVFMAICADITLRQRNTFACRRASPPAAHGTYCMSCATTRFVSLCRRSKQQRPKLDCFREPSMPRPPTVPPAISPTPTLLLGWEVGAPRRAPWTLRWRRRRRRVFRFTAFNSSKSEC